MNYDAVLLVGFGGPEGPDDVRPFLENVVRGKRVPPERLEEVAGHYDLFGGVSPYNEQMRTLLVALVNELNAHGRSLPVYWGNRHWHPMLPDAVAQMAHDGVRRALAFVASAFGSEPGCRQYLDAIAAARAEVGPGAPEVEKLRLFFNHPGFIDAWVDRIGAASAQAPEAPLVFTAHSIPLAMAEVSPYCRQLKESCRLIADRLGRAEYALVYQSRSGPLSQPWLQPDICEHLAKLGEDGSTREVVIAPIGFLVEHMEVIYDLDVQANAVCEHFGMRMIRAPMLGAHPRFVAMIRELIEERLDPSLPRLTIGNQTAWPDICPEGCCCQAKRQ